MRTGKAVGATVSRRSVGVCASRQRSSVAVCSSRKRSSVAIGSSRKRSSVEAVLIFVDQRLFGRGRSVIALHAPADQYRDRPGGLPVKPDVPLELVGRAVQDRRRKPGDDRQVLFGEPNRHVRVVRRELLRCPERAGDRAVGGGGDGRRGPPGGRVWPPLPARPPPVRSPNPDASVPRAAATPV